MAHGGPVALLIVGLGNPGPEYHGTRHNAGAMAVDRLAGRWNVPLRRNPDLRARVARHGDTVIAVPESYMNESGGPVQRLVHGLDAPRPLVVSDDLDLAPGVIRFRIQGSAGGHNGLASIIALLGTREFPRLKIGIGRPEDRDGVTDWVLSRPQGEEAHRVFLASIDRAAEALALAAEHGLNRAMTEHSA